MKGLGSIFVLLGMTEYAPRGSQDHNSVYSNTQFGMSHYSNGSGIPYFYSNGQIQYQTVNPSYPTYSQSYQHSLNGLPNPSTSMYMPTTSSMGMQYQALPPSRGAITKQSRTMLYPSHPSSTLPTHRQPPLPRLSLGTELNLNPMADIESQDSINRETMLSEPIAPPLEGYPDVKDFDELIKQ